MSCVLTTSAAQWQPFLPIRDSLLGRGRIDSEMRAKKRWGLIELRYFLGLYLQSGQFYSSEKQARPPAVFFDVAHGPYVGIKRCYTHLFPTWPALYEM